MPFTSVLDESETAVVFDELNVAVSAAPLGTVAGVQFPDAFQSPDAGNVSHVALPAKDAPPDSSRPSASERNRGGEVFTHVPITFCPVLIIAAAAYRCMLKCEQTDAGLKFCKTDAWCGQRGAVLRIDRPLRAHHDKGKMSLVTERCAVA